MTWNRYLQTKVNSNLPPLQPIYLWLGHTILFLNSAVWWHWSWSLKSLTTFIEKLMASATCDRSERVSTRASLGAFSCSWPYDWGLWSSHFALFPPHMTPHLLITDQYIAYLVPFATLIMTYFKFINLRCSSAPSMKIKTITRRKPWLSNVVDTSRIYYVWYFLLARPKIKVLKGWHKN